jgi:hypothetical protein
MKKILPLIFAFAALGGCSKSSDTPTPAPPTQPTTATVVARWQVDSTWVTDGTQAGLKQKTQLQVFRPSLSVEFTGSQYLLYNGTTVDKQIPYTMGTGVIHLGGTGGTSDRTIRELTPHRMVLVGLRDVTPLNPLAQSITTYSR